MFMDQINQDEIEKARHEDAINLLCQEFPDQIDFIRVRYMEILESVLRQASIHSYLTILISREVKTLLRIRSLTQSNE